MSETVIRIRHTPGGLDSNNDPLPSTTVRTELKANAVAPGASAANAKLGREGETVEYSVYFLPAVDLEDDDQLEVRGRRCNIRVIDWRSPRTTRRGLVIIASQKRG